jgi:RimJ/RimL family protein N-acetyltransferase
VEKVPTIEYNLQIKDWKNMNAIINSKVILKNGLEAVICPACAEDAPQLLEGFKSVAMEEKFVLSTLSDIEKLAPSIEKEAEWIKNTFDGGGMILTAKINKKIEGYISISIDAMTRRKHIAVIGICIFKRYRNIGAGKALMESAINWAKENPKIEKLALSVFADNASAIKLYEKLGFLTEGRQVREIKRGKNDYVDTIMMYMFV